MKPIPPGVQKRPFALKQQAQAKALRAKKPKAPEPDADQRGGKSDGDLDNEFRKAVSS